MCLWQIHRPISIIVENSGNRKIALVCFTYVTAVEVCVSLELFVPLDAAWSAGVC